MMKYTVTAMQTKTAEPTYATCRCVLPMPYASNMQRNTLSQFLSQIKTVRKNLKQAKHENISLAETANEQPKIEQNQVRIRRSSHDCIQ